MADGRRVPPTVAPGVRVLRGSPAAEGPPMSIHKPFVRRRPSPRPRETPRPSRGGFVPVEALLLLALFGGLAAAVLVAEPTRTAAAAAVTDCSKPIRDLVAVGGSRGLTATLYDDRCLLRSPVESAAATLWIRTGDDWVAAIAGSESPARIAVCRFLGEVAVFDADTRRPLFQADLGLADVTAAALTADGSRLAVAGEEADRGPVIALIDVESGVERSRFPCGASQALAFLPDGRLVGQAQGDAVAAWDADTGRETQRLEESATITSLDVGSDGSTVALGAVDGRIVLWNVETGAVAGRDAGHSGAVLAVAFLPDGRIASGGVDAEIRVWDERLGSCALWKGHRRSVRALANVGGTLVSGGYDGVARLWTPAGVERARFELR